MNKWIILTLLCLLGAQSVFAQSKEVSWKELLFGTAYNQTQEDVEKKIEAALIKQLQSADKTPQEEGEIRAYKYSPKAIVNIQFHAPSYVPSNYNKQHAANCQALLLDNRGTLLLNETCRKALYHTKKILYFTVDFSRLLPKTFLQVKNYPRNIILMKDNYALARIPLTYDISKRLPAISAPVFVAQRDRWFTEGEKYILPFSISSLFDRKFPQEKRNRLAESLPEEFSSQVPGFN